MFTGLIEDIGEIKKTVSRGNGLQMSIQCSIPVEEIAPGDSIAVDGVCLTVTGLLRRGFTADLSPESLKRTTLGSKQIGRRVNLERALRLSDRLGGHLVTGHIDGMAAVASVERKGDFTQIGFTAPENILNCLIDKGSVAVNGVSLTVNQCDGRGFDVMVIPHSLSKTTLAGTKAGDSVNIENDILGKYVEKFFERGKSRDGGVNREMLEKFKFII